MATPQPAIFGKTSHHHYFLEFGVPPETPGREAGAALANLRGAIQARGGVQSVMAFSRPLWAALGVGEPPALLRPFRTLRGRGGKTVPGTQNDLWLWLAGEQRDRVFAAALDAAGLLAEFAALRLEQPAFHYLDSRDLTGFIDGTANPEGAEAREAALIPPGEPGAGGSYVVAMRWLHDLAAFHALPVARQEQAIGRRKVDSEELQGADKPETSHISRVEIEQDGQELPIFRRSVPFGTLAAHGLYFLAFSRHPERFQTMLERMYGLAPDGLEDRLTDFSRPTSAAYYFAPSEPDLLRALGKG